MAVSTKKMAMRKGQSGTALMAVIAGDCYSVAMKSRGEEHLATGLEGEIPGSTEAAIQEEGTDEVSARGERTGPIYRLRHPTPTWDV